MGWWKFRSFGFLVGLGIGLTGPSWAPVHPAKAAASAFQESGDPVARVEALLRVDRLDYYFRQLQVQWRKRGFSREAALLAQATPQELEKRFGADPRIQDPLLMDDLAEEWVRGLAAGRPLASKDALRWTYPFFKKKLGEYFRLSPHRFQAVAGSPPSARSSAPPSEWPPLEAGLDPNEVTLDVEDYASWKTTRAIFWEADRSGWPVEFHLGSPRDFQLHLQAQGGRILGEVKSPGRNYNPIFLVEVPASEPGGRPSLQVAVTGISGRDRLQHLMQQVALLRWGKGTANRLDGFRVYGSPLAQQMQVRESLTRIYRELPRADRVVIGQKSAILGALRASAWAARVLTLASRRAVEVQALLTDAENKLLARAQKPNFTLMDAAKEASTWDRIGKKLQGLDPSPLEDGLELDLDLGSHEVADVRVRTRSGKVERWRLISNTWGDEIVPIAQAVKASGNHQVIYIGTAGALPGSGLEVGAVVQPVRADDGSGQARLIPRRVGDTLPAFIRREGTVANVRTPFEETRSWLERLRGRAQLVELETAHLVRVFDGPEDSLEVFLLVSDLVGTEADLAAASQNSGHAQGKKRLLDHLLGSVFQAERPVGGLPSGGRVDADLARVQRLAPKRDSVSQVQLARLLKARGITQNDAALALIQSEPAFTASSLEQSLLELGAPLESLLLGLEGQGLAARPHLRQAGWWDGTWSPKRSPLEVLLAVDTPAQEAAVREALAEWERGLSVQTRKRLQVKLERGPPRAEVWGAVPPQWLRARAGLLALYQCLALEWGGLVARTTPSGNPVYDIIRVRSSSSQSSRPLDALAFFTPDEATLQWLARFDRRQSLEPWLRGWLAQIADELPVRIEKVAPKGNQFSEGQQASLEPDFVAGQPVGIKLRITEAGLHHPMVVLEELLHIAQIYQFSWQHQGVELIPPSGDRPNIWFETHFNAKNGSRSAQTRLALLEVEALSSLEILLARYPELLSAHERVLAGEYLKARKAHAGNLLEEARQVTKSDLADRERLWAIQKKRLDSIESSSEAKLNELVARNDRVGVRKLLEAYLPWPLMEPAEKAAWREWLVAIENPDPSRLKVVFRGLSDDRLMHTPDGKPFLFSTLLTRNQGSYTHRLRSLETMRERLHQQASSFVGGIRQVLLMKLFSAHAISPKGSPFLSFSSLEVALNFSQPRSGPRGQVRVGVFRIDERRLVGNPGGWNGEAEVLAPLMVFPDEVVDLIDGPSDQPVAVQPWVRNRFRLALEKALGRAPQVSDFLDVADASEIIRPGSGEPFSLDAHSGADLRRRRQGLGWLKEAMDRYRPLEQRDCVERALEREFPDSRNSS